MMGLIRKSGFKIGMIAVLTMVLLAGCSGENRVDYTIEGMEQEQQPQGEEGKSGPEQLAEEETWQETWMVKTGEREWEGKMLDVMTDIQVNAEITVPQTKQMAVVEVEEPEFDAEYKEGIAERLFDGEIYYGDYVHLPRGDLQKLQAMIQEGFVVRWDDVTRTGKEYEKDFQEMLSVLNNMENAAETYTVAEEFSTDEYIGTYEGQLFDLCFLETEGDSSSKRRYKRIIWKVRDMSEVCPEQFKEQEDIAYAPWTRGNWVENQCKISEEEALQEAGELVEKLGLDYSVFSLGYPLVWGNVAQDTFIKSQEESEDWVVDGYVFCFDLGVDNISFVDYGEEEDYSEFYSKTDKREERQYSLNTRLQVYVTDMGVIQMVADNPLEITGITEGVELLPLDTIKGIIKEKMNEEWSTFRIEVSDTEFNEMELIYFRVRDKENPGKYSYVPAWRLAAVTKDALQNQMEIRHPILINAIDGSVIDFFDET